MLLEFVTEKSIASLSKEELFNYIIRKVLDNRILIMEKEFNDDDWLALIEKALTEATTETSVGINMVKIPVETRVSGRLRSKSQSIQFNLFAPGTSVIDKKADGHFAIKSYEGQILAEV